MIARGTRGPLFGLLVATVLSGTSLAAYSWYRWDRATRLTIIYASDLQGELDPCACIEGLLGGLARRATFVAGVREEGTPTLLVDSGGIFFRAATIPEHLRDQLSSKAESIVQAYDAMSYDVVNIGDADLALGEGRLRELGEKASFPFLSSSFAGTGDSGPIQRYIIRDVGKLKIGIFGLFRGEGPETASEDKGVIAAAGEIVKALRPKVDIVLCLSHQGLSKDVDLARAVDGIDIILGGRSGNSLPKPRIEEGTIILQTGRRGNFIGRFDLVLYNDSDPWQDATESEMFKRHAEEYEALVVKQRSIRDSTDDPSEKYSAERMVEKYTRETELARAKVKDFFGLNHFYNQVVPLNRDFEDDGGILDVIATYKRRVKELARGGEQERDTGPTLYLGAGACQDCHQAEYDSWKLTPHAHAYATLEDTDQEFDLECVGCHTTGYRKEGGFEAAAAVGVLKDVQCEVCHGPGAGHPKDKPKLPLLVSDGVCLDCHTKEFNPEFEFETFWARIAHRRSAAGGGRSSPDR